MVGVVEVVSTVDVEEVVALNEAVDVGEIDLIVVVLTSDFGLATVLAIGLAIGFATVFFATVTLVGVLTELFSFALVLAFAFELVAIFGATNVISDALADVGAGVTIDSAAKKIAALATLFIGYLSSPGISWLFKVLDDVE